MKAIILCAGKGKRLGLKYKPKPMAKVAGLPIVSWILTHLTTHGIMDICVNLHHLPLKLIEQLGMTDITFSGETKLMGTAGALKRIGWWFGDDFVVANGDTISNVDLTEMYEVHKMSGNVATIFTHDTAEHNGGTFIFKQSILKYIPEGKYSIHKDLIPDLIRRGIPITLYKTKAFYLDCSTPKKLKRARRFFCPKI